MKRKKSAEPEVPDLNSRQGVLPGLYMVVIPSKAKNNLAPPISVREDGFYLVEAALIANGVQFHHWGPNLISAEVWSLALDWLKKFKARVEDAENIDQVPELKRNLHHVIKSWTSNFSGEKPSIINFIDEISGWLTEIIQPD